MFLKPRSRGFTLIELMITVAVVAVLAAVAYPAYWGQIRKANRSAAQQFMSDVASREQQILLDLRGYAPVASTSTNGNFPNAPTSVCGTPGTAGLGFTASPSVTANYTFGVVCSNTATPPTFTVTGTPVAGTRQASDGVLTLSSDGSKTRNGVNGW